MENKNGLLMEVNASEGKIFLDGGNGTDWVFVAEVVKPFLGRLKPGQVEYSMIEDKVSFIRNKTGSYAAKSDTYSVEKPGQIERSVGDKILNQFSVREAIKMIEVFNQAGDEKIAITKKNIFEHAKIIKQIVNDL